MKYWLPRKFYLTAHGGWLSPYGTYYPLYYVNTEDSLLRRVGKFKGQNLKLQALQKGWVRLSYDQWLGVQWMINPKKTERFISFTYDPKYTNDIATMYCYQILLLLHKVFNGDLTYYVESWDIDKNLVLRKKKRSKPMYTPAIVKLKFGELRNANAGRI
jgi:hypothetical protein